MRVFHLKGPLYAIKAPRYSQTLLDAAKPTPGMVWSKPLLAWIGYRDAVATVAKKIASRVDIDGDIPQPFVGNPLIPVAEKHLREFQVEALRFVVTHADEGCILGDEPGMGKTAVAVRAARAFRAKTVVVCPAHLRSVWYDELPRKKSANDPRPEGWPGVSWCSLEGTKAEPLPEDIEVVVVHYDILYAWVDALIAWGARFAILDEGHYLTNSKARRTKSAQKLTRTCTWRLALTGTPMTSKVAQLHALVETISPGRFGEHPFRFFARHCNAFQKTVGTNPETQKVVWDFSGSSNEEELHDRLRHFMLRRLKSEVALQLPDKTRQIIEVAVKKKFAVSASSTIAGGRINENAMRAALDLSGDGKIDDVLALIQDHVDAGSKIVVGCHRKALVERYADALVGMGIDATWSHGELADVERQKRMKEQHDVLVVTIDSTSTGLNLLTYANVAIVAELIYKAHELKQWEDRFHRPGQKRNVLIQYVIGLSTADELVARVVVKKLEVEEKVVGKSTTGLKEDLDRRPEDPLGDLYMALMQQSGGV